MCMTFILTPSACTVAPVIPSSPYHSERKHLLLAKKLCSSIALQQLHKPIVTFWYNAYQEQGPWALKADTTEAYASSSKA